MYDNPLNQVQYPAAPPAASAPSQALGPAAPAAPRGPAAPMHSYYQPIESEADDEGNYGYGIFWGLIGGLVIFLIVMGTAKSETKRGAVHAFCAKMVLVFMVYAYILMSNA